MLEARVARLEADVEHIKTDIHDIKLDLREIRSEMKSGFDTARSRDENLFRDMKNDFESARNRNEKYFLLLLGVLITAVLGLAGLMAKGFKWF